MLRLILVIVMLCLPFAVYGESQHGKTNISDLRDELTKVQLPIPPVSEIEKLLRDRYVILTTETLGNDLWLIRTFKKIAVLYNPDMTPRWEITELEVTHAFNPVGWLVFLVFLGFSIVSGMHGENRIRPGASMVGIVAGIILAVTLLVLEHMLETTIVTTIAILLLFFIAIVATQTDNRWLLIAQAMGVLVGSIIIMYIGTPDFRQVFTNLLVFSGIAVLVEVVVVIARAILCWYRLTRILRNKRTVL